METTTHPASLETGIGTLENEGACPSGMATVEYRAWVGQDDMVSVSLPSEFARRIERIDPARPWSACIWPRHMDGTRHDDCTGHCVGLYRTAEQAGRALEREYVRRYGTEGL